MRAAFLVPCRNKAPWVGACVRSVLAQTEPLAIYLSDQGSTDGSYEVMEAEVSFYGGPHEIRLLRCPETRYRGTAGYNTHLNWLMEQVGEDIVLMTSADDLVHPERAARELAIYREKGVDAVGSKLRFLGQDGNVQRMSWPEIDASGMVPADVIAQARFGGQTTSGWTRALWERLGGLPPMAAQDLVVPLAAALGAGFYYLNEPLHDYVERPDGNNMGLEGRYRNAADDEERHQIAESMNYLMLANVLLMQDMLRPALQAGDEAAGKAFERLTEQFFDQGSEWVRLRNTMMVRRIRPEMFPI